MNIALPHTPVALGLRRFAAAMALTLVASCGGGGGGEDVDPTTPTIATASATRAVVRKDDTTPLPAAFAVTVTDPGTGTVAWRDESGASRGSGLSLALPATATALAAGEHTLTANITNPRNGRSAEVQFSLLVLAATANTDDDNDGLTYDQEKAAGTSPSNPDSDNDGLADGAEAGLGTDPARADTDGNGVADGVQVYNTATGGTGGASLPTRSLVSGTTTGLTLGADNLTLTFGSQLNQDCVNGVAPYNDPVYTNSPSIRTDRCAKRAMRANVGVAPGEFRYFEARRLSGPTEGELANIGYGIIIPSAPLDPYCCYVSPVAEPALYASWNGNGATPGTPPSMTFNAIGGVFARLIGINPAVFSPLVSEANTVYYGFAVDYRGTNPVVYIVGVDSTGAMTVSNAVNPGPFGGAPAMPMMHGHPVAAAGPHVTMNLGATRFNYSLADVRTALTGKGVTNASAMAGGVGIHRW